MMLQKKLTLGNQILSQSHWPIEEPYIIPIKKARKNRLYDFDGNIYIDFYLQNGGISLGYKQTQLSTQISNRLSMGYLSGFSHHLAHRATSNIQDFIKLLYHSHHKYKIFYFMSLQTRRDFFIENNIPYKSGNIYNEDLFKISQAIALDLFCSNGAPIYIALVPPQEVDDNKYRLPTDICNLYYQSIITTTQQLIKQDIRNYIQKLLAPYKSLVNIQENFFTLDISTEKWGQLVIHSQKYGIILHPTKPQFFICLATTPQDIKYLFKVLNFLN